MKANGSLDESPQAQALQPRVQQGPRVLLPCWSQQAPSLMGAQGWLRTRYEVRVPMLQLLPLLRLLLQYVYQRDIYGGDMILLLPFPHSHPWGTHLLRSMSLATAWVPTLLGRQDGGPKESLEESQVGQLLEYVHLPEFERKCWREI